jgi:hypothetical protein
MPVIRKMNSPKDPRPDNQDRSLASSVEDTSIWSSNNHSHHQSAIKMSTPLALNATELGFMGRNYKSPFPTTPNNPPTLTPTQLVLSPSNLINPGGEPVNKLIYAGFLEHLGRCIYGGIVDDPKEPSDKKLLIEQGNGKLGVRKDVVEVLGAEGELAVPMLRWPGGMSIAQTSDLS